MDHAPTIGTKKDISFVKKAHANVCKLFEKEKEAKEKANPSPFNHKWEPVLQSIEETLSVLNCIPISPENESNLLDLRFDLIGLKGEIELLITYPEVAFLASHVDSILTRIQFADELAQETLHPLIFDTELRTHDLQDFRLVRDYRESTENEDALVAINIGNWAQYPFKGLREISLFNQKNKGKESQIITPKAITLRVQSACFSLKGEIYDTGFTPAKGKKERSEITLAKGPLMVQQELFELVSRLLSMEKACLEQILEKSSTGEKN